MVCRDSTDINRLAKPNKIEWLWKDNGESKKDKRRVREIEGE